MLSDDAIDNLMEPIIERQEAINNYVIDKIARRVREIGHLLPSDIRQLEQLLKTGSDVRQINAEISRLTGRNIVDIKKMIRAIAVDAYLDAKPYYDYRYRSFIPFNKNEHLKNIVKAIENQTLQTYKNLSNSSGFMLRDTETGKLRPTKISKTYQKIVDEAIQATQTGVMDYNTAMRRTMQQLHDSGIRYITYHPESGRVYSQRLDTAVRRNLLDGVRQINQGVQDEVGKQFGADGKEISVHAFSAPDHEPVQGHQFSNEEYDKLQNNEPFTDYKGNRFDAIARPIGFWNCRHFTFSIILGIIKPNYTKKQLDKFIKDNNKGIKLPGGRHYTMYEVTQKMRQLETNVRRCKDGIMMARTLGDDELVSKYKQKMKKYKNEYKYITNLSGLKPRPDKMRVTGYHN